MRQTVTATYIKCTGRPRKVGEKEPLTAEKVKKFLRNFFK